MAALEASEDREDAGATVLIAAFLLAPFAWLLEMQVSYAMVKWACENARGDLLRLLPLGSLALIALGAWLSWSSLSRLRGVADEEGDREIDRSYFLAAAALAMNAIFGLLVLTSFIPRYVLSPCE